MKSDLTAAPSTGSPAAAAGGKPRRTGRWLLAGLLVLLMLTVLATTLVVLGLLDGAREGLTFVVDGEPWRLASDGDWDIDGGTVLGAALAALVIVTLLAAVLPLALLALLLCLVLPLGLALLAGALGLALGLGAVLLTLALVLSPLWGGALLLWLLLRKPKPAVAV